MSYFHNSWMCVLPTLSSCISRMFMYEMCSDTAAQLTNCVRPLFLRATGWSVSPQDMKMGMYSMPLKGITPQYFPLISIKMVSNRNCQFHSSPFLGPDVFHDASSLKIVHNSSGKFPAEMESSHHVTWRNTLTCWRMTNPWKCIFASWHKAAEGAEKGEGEYDRLNTICTFASYTIL
jgi:hypothetical protein